MMVYEISQLTKLYGERTILDVPELHLESGRIYALVGPNGAGKTTLLNILGFLESPSTGKVSYRERPVKYNEAHLQGLRKSVVIVDQHPILFTTTVYKNVEFGLKLRGIQKKERSRTVQEVLDLVGMKNFTDSPAHFLSGGETQRVALARALAVSPDVFLCDEPTSSIDTENQDIIMNILRQINEEKKITVIFTTHDRTQASTLAHTTLVLDHGRLSGKGYENVFTVEFIPQDPDQWQCIIQDTLKLFFHKESKQITPGRKRIFIDPEKIVLTDLSRSQNRSNCYKGRVTQVSEENGNIRLVADIGLKISIVISRDKYYRAKPMVGEYIGLVLDTDSIHTL